MRGTVKTRYKRVCDEHVLEAGEVRKIVNLDLVEVFSPSEEPEGRKRKEEMGYSLTGITSGLVMKRTIVGSAKTCGRFSRDWP
jgi:hypothetical protein